MRDLLAKDDLDDLVNAADFPLSDDVGPAFFSEDRRYRYALAREWSREGIMLLFIGLNPSTADENKLDPTMRRVIGFAKREGFKGVWMGNLFALRSTDPKLLRTSRDPVGPENNRWLAKMAHWSRFVCFGWGMHGVIRNRGNTVAELLSEYGPFCLGTTKGGHPRHPLYLKGDTEMVKYS